MEDKLNSLNNFDFWRKVLPECTKKGELLICRPLPEIWTKTNELGL